MFSDKPIDFDRFVRMLLTAVLCVSIYLLLDQLSNVLLPFFLAWLTAYLFNPITSFYHKWVKRQGLAVALTLLSVLVITVGLGWLIIPMIIEEFETLNRLVSSKVAQLEIPNWIPADLWNTFTEYLNRVDVATLVQKEGLREQVVGLAESTWNASSKVFGVFGALFGVVTYLLYLVFIMLDYENLTTGWVKLIPAKYRAFTTELVDDLEDGMNGYFNAQTKIVVSVAVLFAIGFKLIGLPFAIMLGLILGFMNYIPYLQLVGLVPAVALAGLHSLETGDSFWITVGLVLLVFVVVQLIQDAFLTPKFMGDFSGFNPAIILLSLSIWGSLLGMIGLIIAIPLTSLLVAYYRKYIIKGKNLDA